MSNLTWDNVDQIIKSSLLNDENPDDAATIKLCVDLGALTNRAALDKNATELGLTLVDAVMNKVAFVTERLEKHRELVVSMIKELNPAFLESEGGGWSMLKLPFNARDEQWGEQWHADLFYAVANGLGLANFNVEDRDMWSALPSGLPYIVFRTEV